MSKILWARGDLNKYIKKIKKFNNNFDWMYRYKYTLDTDIKFVKEINKIQKLINDELSFLKTDSHYDPINIIKEYAKVSITIIYSGT